MIAVKAITKENRRAAAGRELYGIQISLIREVSTFMGFEVKWPWEVETRGDENFTQHFSRVFEGRGLAFLLKNGGEVDVSAPEKLDIRVRQISKY